MSSHIISHQVNIRLVAGLSATALKAKQDKELAMWYCLRALSTTGDGYINLERAIEGLTGVFNYGPRTITRLLQAGEGIFWRREFKYGRTRIAIQALKRVCLYFNTSLIGTDIRFKEVPAEEFNTLRKRRANMLASTFKPQGVRVHPISRQSIEEHTGVKERTQQYYCRIARVDQKKAWCPAMVEKQLPNRYHFQQVLGHTGMLRKIRRQLKSLVIAEAVKRQRYFTSIKQYSNIKKHREVDDVVYILTTRTDRQFKGNIAYMPMYGSIL